MVVDGLHLADDDRVLFHDTERGQVHEITEPEEELRALFSERDYIEACDALGLDPVVVEI